MTLPLAAADVAARLRERLPQARAEARDGAVVVDREHLWEVARLLKSSPELHLDYLAAITAVDWVDRFEIIYHLTSLKYNHSLVLKVPCPRRLDSAVPSVTDLWQGADFQEREVYDLMGISFTGHPSLKRILLWEGYPGHPLRKDFVY